MYTLILHGQPHGSQRKSYLSSPTHSNHLRPFPRENQSCSATTRGTTQAEISPVYPRQQTQKNPTH